MSEKDKQNTDQQKNNDVEKERQQHSHKDAKKQEKQQAGMSTDPQAMKDEGYVKRIDEKTSRH
jgi:hypothetical protein